MVLPFFLGKPQGNGVFFIKNLFVVYLPPYYYIENRLIMGIDTDSNKQYSAFALIKTGEENDLRYLLQWNIAWGMFNLIGGKLDNHKGDRNILARTLQRELEEELGLKRQTEILILKELEQIELRQYSYRERKVKDYHMAIYEVDLFPNLPLERNRRHHVARWLSTGRENIFATKKEIINLRTFCGRPISLTTRRILAALGELEVRCSQPDHPTELSASCVY